MFIIRKGNKYSLFGGDIHRVVTFTHVSSLTVVAGIFSRPLHGSQRFLCVLLIVFKVATNLCSFDFLSPQLAMLYNQWLFNQWQPLTLALNLNFLLLPLSSGYACGDASICQIILVLRKPPLLLF